MKKLMIITLLVVLAAVTIFVPMLLKYENAVKDDPTEPGYATTITDEDRVLDIDGYEIELPAGYKFVQWATEGKSYIVEDQYGIQTIVILEFN